MLAALIVAAQVGVLPFSSPVSAAPGMTVTKTAVPARGSSVQTGDTITYTIEVANTSTAGEPLTGLDVDDALPDGVTFVSGTVSGVRSLYEYRDDFSPTAADGSDGATDWSSTPWVKTGADGTSETGGNTRIENGRLRIRTDEEQVFFARAFDLSGCTGQTATLSFDWEKDGDLNDTVFVELFNPGTSTWEVQTSFFGGPDTTGTYSTAIANQFFAAGAELRFRTTANDKIEDFFVDNVEISTDGLCGLITPDPAVGTPPSLVEPADGFAIGAGETATITVDVTVDGTDQVLDNSATATTNEVAATTSNTVTHDVQMLTVTKSASPPDGSNVLQGDTISYTIEVENTSGVALTDFALADVLPTGVTYSAGTAQISGARTLRQYRDEFDNIAYNNTDGSTAWTATWDETNDDDDPTGGNIEVQDDDNTGHEFVLKLDDSNGQVARAIPLGGCVSGTVSFDWRPDESVSSTQFVYFELFNPTDGWVTQETFTNLSSTTTYTTTVQSIPASFLVAGAQLRFRDGGDGRRLYFDNVDVSAVCDLVTPGTSVNGPADLVQASDGYAIGAGETATVTFDVTVDTLPVGTATLLLQNDATASTAEAADVTSNIVEHTVVSLPFFRGSVYFDRDGSNDLSAGDPPTGETLYAKLINGGGTVVDVVPVDVGTGAYEFQAVAAGTYSIIIDDNNSAGDTTPNLPNDWDFANPATGTITGVVSGGDGAADVDDLDVGVTRSADLELTKTVDDSTAWNLGTATYTLSVVNNGPDDVTDVVVADLLPAGVTYDSHGGDGSYDAVTGDWSVSSLNAGQTVDLDIVASVTAAEGVVVTNDAEVIDMLGVDPDSTPNNGVTTEDDDATVDFTVPPRPPADLELDKTVDASTAYANGSVTYTLSLTNQGPNPSGAVVVEDVLPSGITFINATGPGTYDSTTGEWALTDVAGGQTVELAIVASVDAGQTIGTVITNDAEVTSAFASDPDSTPGNGNVGEDDDTSVDFTVIAPPTADLAVTKSANVTNAGPGELVSYTIDVTNNGPDPIGGATLTDVLPTSLAYQTSSTLPIGNGAYDPVSGEWTFGALAVGETATLILNVEVIDQGVSTPSSVSNTATVAVPAPVVDPVPSNDSDDATFGIPRADLSLEKKIDGQDSIFTEVLNSHTFTITITNAGPSTATNVVVDDVLGSGYVFQGSTASLGSYDQGLWTIPSLPVGS
ncbi:MAG: hypothetical protein ACN4IE_22510, partial [Ilumatobacter sp.]